MESKKGVRVRVVCRCRPRNNKEEKSHDEVVTTPNHRTSEISVLHKNKGTQKNFLFDRVFGPNATQAEVYEDVVSPIVHEVLKGFNCTVFAYGQTGTGKTFTMEGISRDNELSGMIPRAIKELFSILDATGTEYVVRVSYLELYNEELRDLFAMDAKQLKLLEDGKRGVCVQGLEELPVMDANEIFTVLEKSGSKRITAATALNSQSSRSHCIFTITIHTKESTEGGEDLVKVGKLNLVDLAGSENMARAGTGKNESRKKEATAINQSLLTLGRVITALSEKAPHIPYRESKLTRLLQESLGGRAKTCIITTVGPCVSALEETLGTLEYACRAKDIRNKPEINQMMSHRALIRDMNGEIEALKVQLRAARDKNGIYLPQEDFQEMEEKIAKGTLMISELEEKIEMHEKELNDMQNMFTKEREEHEQEKQLREEREKELAETQRELNATTEFLTATKKELEVHQKAIENKEETEEQLRKHAIDLIAKLRQSMKHSESLHAKIQRQSNLLHENNKKIHQFKDYSTKKFDSINDSSKKFVSGQIKGFIGICNTANEAREAYEDLLRNIDENKDKENVMINETFQLLHSNANTERTNSISVISEHESNSLQRTRDISSRLNALIKQSEKGIIDTEELAEKCTQNLKNWEETNNNHLKNIQDNNVQFFDSSVANSDEITTLCSSRSTQVREEEKATNEEIARVVEMQKKIQENLSTIAKLTEENQKLSMTTIQMITDVKQSVGETNEKTNGVFKSITEKSKSFTEKVQEIKSSNDEVIQTYKSKNSEFCSASKNVLKDLQNSSHKSIESASTFGKAEMIHAHNSHKENEQFTTKFSAFANEACENTQKTISEIVEKTKESNDIIKSLTTHGKSAAFPGGSAIIEQLGESMNSIGTKEGNFCSKSIETFKQYKEDLNVLLTLKDDIPTGETPVKKPIDFITPRRLPQSKRVADFRDGHDEPATKKLTLGEI